jgi:hypothetical protein
MPIKFHGSEIGSGAKRFQAYFSVKNDGRLVSNKGCKKGCKVIRSFHQTSTGPRGTGTCSRWVEAGSSRGSSGGVHLVSDKLIPLLTSATMWILCLSYQT